MIWESLDFNDCVNRQKEEVGHGLVENGVDQTEGGVALVEGGVRPIEVRAHSTEKEFRL